MVEGFGSGGLFLGLFFCHSVRFMLFGRKKERGRKIVVAHRVRVALPLGLFSKITRFKVNSD